MGRYQDALDYIFSYVNYEKPSHASYNSEFYNLQRLNLLLERMGMPQKRFRSVHIAGTKGKGSTSAMIESVLRTAGFKTGLFTSPHLHSFRERIRFGGKLIPKKVLADILDELRPAIESVPGVTAFEVMTALAFTYYAWEGVEWAVLETGLGGRLDATNVVMPAVSPITSISFDHMELLGHTLESIAREKAGIIKPGVPVVSSPQAPEAMAVIRETAARLGSRLIVAGEDWIATPDLRFPETLGVGVGSSSQTFDLRRKSDGLRLNDLHIPLLGSHQIDNAAVAVAVIAELREQGVLIPDPALRAGLLATRWPGRLELLGRKPAVMVDCAHNTDSALKLRTALAHFFPARRDQRMTLIFGASADKDIAGMFDLLLANAPDVGYVAPDRVIVTRSGHPRQADPNTLAEMLHSRQAPPAVIVRDSLDEALAEALASAEADDLICITGSIFVVAQARLAWAKQHPEAFLPDDWVFQDETPGQVAPDRDGS